MRAASLLVLMLLLAQGPAQAQRSAPVRSLLELRREQVIVQQWDVSCGAAALATLLTFQHGHPVSEKAVAEGMLRRTDPLRVKHRGGFSLLDLKRYAQSQGFEAQAFSEMELESLEASKPAIVPVDLNGYPHFVMYRGRVGNTVLLADPAFGNHSISIERFSRAWLNGIAFTVSGPGGSAGAHTVVRQQDFIRPDADALRRLLH
jgi:predicted double-glycine peptidase